MSKLPWILVVSGPTASGKSELGLRLAKKLDGEIVSLDSVQVFRGFDIGAAKPSQRDRKEVVHHCIDILDPQDTINAGKMVSLGREAIEAIIQKGRLPIVVAGTTLYLTSLLHGLADLPEASAEIRTNLRATPLEELYLQLCKRDPESAKRLHPNDRVRIERALEASLLGKERYSSAINSHQFESLKYRALIIVLCWPRAKLYERINTRTQQMLEAGLLEETKTLVEHHGEAIQGLRSLGYAQASKVLSGNLERSDLGPRIAQFTRRFAKRQVTFWRNEPQKRGWDCDPQQAKSSVGKTPTDLQAATINISQLDNIILGARDGHKSQVSVHFVDMERLNQDLVSA